MYTKSLYESKISNGKSSLSDMLNGKQKNAILEEIAKLIVRGVWPLNRETPDNLIGAMLKSYINSILDNDAATEEKKYDKNKLSILLKKFVKK